jgi:hypothetical protein
MQVESFRRDLRAYVERFADGLDEPLADDSAWIGVYCREVRDLFRDALGR